MLLTCSWPGTRQGVKVEWLEFGGYIPNLLGKGKKGVLSEKQMTF